MSPDLDDGLNLSGFLHKLRKYWVSTLCIIVVSTLIGCISYFILPKTYKATMTLKIGSYNGQQIESNAVLITVLKDEQFLKTLKKSVEDSVSKSPINLKTFIGRDLGELVTIDIIGRTADETKKILNTAAHLLIERDHVLLSEKKSKLLKHATTQGILPEKKSDKKQKTTIEATIDKLKENISSLKNVLKNTPVQTEYYANLLIKKLEYELQLTQAEAQAEDAITETKIISTTDPSVPVSASLQKSLYLGLFAGILFAIGSLSLRRDHA